LNEIAHQWEATIFKKRGVFSDKLW
jgi:hypothetical protein